MLHSGSGRGSHSKKSQIHYSSKLMSALNRFASVISTEVKNPLLEKYGDAYDYLIKGDAHRLREEIEEAIRAYEVALAINPSFIEAYIGMGRCFRRKGDIKRAISSFSKALSLNAFDKETHLELAKSYNEGGMPVKALHHFRQAVKIDPDSIDAKFNLALCLELQGEMAEPTRLYEEILKADPEFLPVYNNLGSIYMRQGHYSASEQMFRRLIEMAPDFSRGYLGLALALDRSNRPQEALMHYEKLMTLKAHYRNKEYIQKRILALRNMLGKKPISTTNGSLLVRVK